VSDTRSLWWASTLGLAVSTGCGHSDTTRILALEVEVRDDAGAHPSAFRAVLTHGASVTAFSCPGAASEQFECTPRGFILPATFQGQLTLKTPGHAFVDVTLGGSTLEAPPSIELEVLSPFVTTVDYRSGFAALDGEAAFEGLAAQTSGELGRASVVKFMIVLGAVPRVYFEDTRRYPRHYEFARDVLGLPESAASFAQSTYQGEGRRALAGTLSLLPDLSFPSGALGTLATSPMALEFFPSDDLTPAQVRLAYRLLEERLNFLHLDGGDRRLFYVPAGTEQEAALALDRAAFSGQEASFSNHVEFYAGVSRQILNPGIAYGVLRQLTPAELVTPIVSFHDLLLLSRLPNDVPLAGGTITEELQTPLSHVNLAARARGTPNLALPGASTDARVAPFIGRLVRFEVTLGDFTLREASLDEAQAFWDEHAPTPLLPESDLRLRGVPSFSELHFEDASSVGTKAANLAELRRLLGDEAPDGFAVPFSAYDDYMSTNRVTAALCARSRAECQSSARTATACSGAALLCDESAADAESYYAFIERLLGDEAFAQDTALREACLSTLELAIGQGDVEPTFAAALDARVREQFGTVQVRLRSSTNVEDLPGFSGAGLYTSVSARATGEARASARIREVWASAWRFRAFEERAFWNVDHRRVRVGVAVNAAVDSEAANGVLITSNLSNPGAEGYYVNVQRGEVEVTNPDDGALAEVFSIVPAPGGGVQVERQRFSSLSPDRPLLTNAEAEHLFDIAERVELRFAALYAVPANTLALDLEFKFVGERRALQIKQVRPYSIPSGP